MNKVLLILILLAMATAAHAQRRAGKKFQYEQVSFEDMIHRYLHRDGQPASEVEGIYSVSCVITRSRRHWLTGHDVVRIVERKDNYARVAILKETMNTKRDFIEVSMSNRDATKYLIVGELNVLAEGGGYIYKHMEPDGQLYTFSMLLTHSDTMSLS